MITADILGMSAVLCFFEIVGNSGTSVTDTNDSASAESSLADQVLHDMVVFMGIDPNIGMLRQTISKASVEDPTGADSRESVYRPVGISMIPLSVNNRIGRIISHNKRKHTANMTALSYYIKLLLLDIFQKHFVGRFCIPHCVGLPCSLMYVRAYS